MLPNYYRLFELDKAATKEDIKKRYRELAKKYHPDVNSSPDATSQMQQIQEAYYILYDDEARSRYNIQYDKVYNKKEETFSSKDYHQDNNRNSRDNKDGTFSFDDPILEKWIINAKRQAADFIRTTYKEGKGIIASGCSHYFKMFGICIAILIGIVLLIMIFRAFASLF